MFRGAWPQRGDLIFSGGLGFFEIGTSFSYGNILQNVTKLLTYCTFYISWSCVGLNHCFWLLIWLCINNTLTINAQFAPKNVWRGGGLRHFWSPGGTWPRMGGLRNFWSPGGGWSQRGDLHFSGGGADTPVPTMLFVFIKPLIIFRTSNENYIF